MPGAFPQTRRVIFLNRFYWPEEPATAQLLTDLAEALARRGFEVSVITSGSGRGGLPSRATHAGVAIRRIRGTRWSQSGLAGKAVDFASFYLGAIWALLRTACRGDCVVALTDPPLLGVGVWLAARLRGARVFHWVQDIYPEIAVALTGQSWLTVLRPLRNLAWRRSDGCVILGADMAATLATAGVSPAKITILPNWAPAGMGAPSAAAVADLRADWLLAGQFVVAYSGNLGRVHDLGPVLDVATALREEAGITFVFIGAGAQRAWLEAEALRRGLRNVHFQLAQPRAHLARTLALGDVHLVTLLPGCEPYVFPSKLYGIAVAGRPVVFIGPPGCEIARQVTLGGFGLAFAREEIAGIADGLRQLRRDPGLVRRLGEAAAEYGRIHAGPARAADVWEGLLANPV
jgi:glycosyltransferase involved in cell wall biosynthesis